MPDLLGFFFIRPKFWVSLVSWSAEFASKFDWDRQKNSAWVWCSNSKKNHCVWGFCLVFDKIWHTLYLTHHHFRFHHTKGNKAGSTPAVAQVCHKHPASGGSNDVLSGPDMSQPPPTIVSFHNHNKQTTTLTMAKTSSNIPGRGNFQNFFRKGWRLSFPRISRGFFCLFWKFALVSASHIKNCTFSKLS